MNKCEFRGCNNMAEIYITFRVMKSCPLIGCSGLCKDHYTRLAPYMIDTQPISEEEHVVISVLKE